MSSGKRTRSSGKSSAKSSGKGGKRTRSSEKLGAEASRERRRNGYE